MTHKSRYGCGNTKQKKEIKKSFEMKRESGIA